MRVINVSLLGQKDHGKSTLIGSLLIQTGAATKVRMKEAEIYSRKLHKPFEPAFILDSFPEEREQGMTYDTTRVEIPFIDVAFALIDVPGHEELIKNMISGASYGEIALLVVSAKKGEGIKNQTKRHLFISRMLGIGKLVVAINKMDGIGYDKDTFDRIRRDLERFIAEIGFDRRNVCFVPISAYKGENLMKKSAEIKWYKGRPLIELLYKYAKSEGIAQKRALRVVVQGVIPEGRKRLVVGKIVSGRVNEGEHAIILPSGNKVTVKGITVKGRRKGSAETGENVALELDGKLDDDLRGSVISSIGDLPRLNDTIKSRVFVTGKLGEDMRIKFNGVEIKCADIRVLSRIDATTGEKTASKEVRPLDALDAKILLSKKIPVERYDVTREIGRFVMYNGNKFVGIGVITS